MIGYSFVLLGIPFLIYLSIILVYPHAYDGLAEYIKNRYGKTFFQTVNNTTDFRFFIILNLLSELIPVFILTVLTLIFSRMAGVKQNIEKEYRLQSLWFFCLALSGTLPLMLTLEQRGFYLITAIPFFILAVTIYIYSLTYGLIEKIKIQSKSFILLRRVSIFIIVCSVLFTTLQFGKTKRDEDILPDIYAIGKVIPRGEVVGIPYEILNEWSLSEYFVRYFYITLDAGTNLHTYFMIRKDLSKNLVPPNYKLYPIHTTFVDLYIREQ